MPRLGVNLALRGRRKAAAWSPAALPGLAAWYTAGPTWCFTDAGGTVPCADGDPIRTWLDRSGNGHTLSQATLAARPILYAVGGGLYVATFDGVDDYVSSNYQPARPHSAAAAFQCARVNADNTLFDFAGGNTARHMVGDTNTSWNWYSGTYLVARGTVPADLDRVVTQVGFAASGSFVRVRGVEQTIANQAGTNPSGGLVVGNYGDPGLSNWYSGDVAELVFSAGVTTAGDRALLDTYLGA